MSRTFADIQILPEAQAGTSEGLVARVVPVDSELHVQLTLPDGRDIWAQLTHESAQELELREGQIRPVHLPGQSAWACA
jgi:ABC-type molybdate transport system ATPase subunit